VSGVDNAAKEDIMGPGGARVSSELVCMVIAVLMVCLWVTTLTSDEARRPVTSRDAKPCGGAGMAENDSPTTETSDDLEERLEKLRSLPYTSLTAEKVDPESSGVVIYRPGQVHPGYNMYCCERCPDILLMDMTGKIVHRWTHPAGTWGPWHHAIMVPDGDVVAISKIPNYLMRLDWHSSVVWKKTMACHHDVVLSPDHTIYVIVGEKRIYRELLVEFPSILHLTPDGEEIDRWSAFEHLVDIRETFDTRSFLDTILDSMTTRRSKARILEPITRRIQSGEQSDDQLLYDYFHMNTVNFLPETPLGVLGSTFRAGNVLICFRNVNQVAILDQNSGKVLWMWGEGVLEWPHHPTMLESGNILVFDNGTSREYSKVIELNPVTKTVEWEYVGDPPESFYSFSRGSAQRLPNGNTLICDGDNGRAFEVTREGEIVWEWLNSLTTEGYREQVYRMMRLSSDEIEGLLATD
jgi:hypothetical protein